MQTATFRHDYDHPGDEPGNFTAYKAGVTYEKVPAEVVKAAREAGALPPEPKADAGR
jgi:hypothetical protein